MKIKETKKYIKNKISFDLNQKCKVKTIEMKKKQT